MDNAPERYLFLVSSSYGHLLPAIRLAHVLQRHRKEVLFVTARENQLLFDSYGIKCVAASNQPHPFLSTYDWYDAQVGVQQYRFIRQVVEEYQPDTIIATPLVMPAFALAETCNIPLVVLGYCEYLFPSPGDEKSSKQWRIESITNHYNALRELLGLAPVAADPARSPLKGDKYLIRSVPQFTAQKDLPSTVEFVGSLLWETQYINHELDRFVVHGRGRGRPLFFLQIGRLFEDRKLWPALVQVLGRMPVDFIVDMGRSDYITEHGEFPENFYLHPFVPLSYVRDDVAGVICGGQTTSVVSAIYYGKPVLGIPNSGDGAEVIQRIIGNGIGAGLFQQEDIREENFMHFLREIEKGRFADRLGCFQQYFRSYDEEAMLYERIAS